MQLQKDYKINYATHQNWEQIIAYGYRDIRTLLQDIKELSKLGLYKDIEQHNKFLDKQDLKQRFYIAARGLYMVDKNQNPFGIVIKDYQNLILLNQRRKNILNYIDFL